MANKEKLDIVRVIHEYCMLKSVLNNKYAKDVVSGKVEPAGPSAAADKKTLQAIQRYVKTLDDLVVSENDLTGTETLDDYFKRISEEVRTADAQKLEAKRANYTENPFDDGYRYFVKDVLNRENAGETIENAIKASKPTRESIDSLVVNLGGKKQSSYIKLLAQSTDLFSSVSGLENQIKTLETEKGSNDELIQKLRAVLSERKAQIKAYKALCNKQLDEFGSDSSVLAVLVKENATSLDGLVRQEAEQTREHITAETNRTLDDMHAKDKIKTYMLANKKNYPRYIAVLSGKQLNDKGMRNLFTEVKHAAFKVNLQESDPAVDAFFNDLSEENIKNTAKMNNTTVANKKIGKVMVGAIAGLLIGAVLGFGGHYLFQNKATVNASNFDSEYAAYVQQENSELEQYKIQLNSVIEDEKIGVYEKTPEQEALKVSLDRYAATDEISKYHWSSTPEMEALTLNAEISAKASYYQNNYEDLLGVVSDLKGQIANLNAQLENANKTIDSLQGNVTELNAKITEMQKTIDSLQEQINTLNSILAASQDENATLKEQISDLQSSLDTANETIKTLEEKVSGLTEENETLKKENEALKKEISILNNEISGLNERITGLENSNKVLASEKAQLEIDNKQLQDQVDSLKKEIEGLKDGTLVEQLQQQVSDLQSQLNAANQRISELTTENEALKNQIVTLNEKVGNLGETIKNLEDTISGLESDKSNLEQENAKLQTEIDQLKVDLTSARSEYNTLLEMYNKLKESTTDPAEIEALKNELNEAYEAISSYESQIVRLYNGLTRESTSTEQASQDLEDLMKMFGIDYKESDDPENDKSEYDPSQDSDEYQP